MESIKFSKKHKLKEDHFVEWLFEARQWVTGHLRPISTAAAVLAVLLLIAFVFQKSRQSGMVRAQETFGKAMIAYENGDQTNALSMFRDLAARHSKTSYAAIGTFMQANSYYEQREYAQAEDFYRKGLKAYQGFDLLKGGNLRGLGNCAIQKKDYSGAVKHFERYLKECPDHYLKSEVLLSLAECQLKLGDGESARSALTSVVRDFPNSAESRTAQNLLATL